MRMKLVLFKNKPGMIWNYKNTASMNSSIGSEAQKMIVGQKNKYNIYRSFTAMDVE